MKISILTICPEQFSGFIKDHVIERAVRLGVLSLEVTDIRDYAPGCFRKVDDSPYGGGAGMILRVQPVMDAVRSVTQGSTGNICRIALTPVGETYTQKTALELAGQDHVVLVCGHYEGMDARIYSRMDRLISVGDYVLSGGEIAAMAIADSVARLLPGVLRPESLQEESFSGEMLEYPQYTRPGVYEGDAVPQVLLSGNHEAIRRWRRERALEKTEIMTSEERES